jgi:hypothetical protein
MEATHLCMAMRGVEKQNSMTTTSAMHGAFRDDARTRSEFLELIRRPDRGQHDRGQVLPSDVDPDVRSASLSKT